MKANEILARLDAVRHQRRELERRIEKGWDRELSLRLDRLVAEEALATETAHREVV